VSGHEGDKVELSGTVVQNLRRAIDSARRHEGRPVYRETIDYWSLLVTHARDSQTRSRERSPKLDQLIGKLSDMLAERQAV
jgi:hypothetical protein